MSKRTVGFRVADDVAEIFEAIKDIEGISSAQAVTTAVGEYIAEIASRNPDFANDVADIAQRRLDRSLDDIANLFGEQVLERLQIRKPE